MMANAPGKSSLFIGDLAIFCSERDIEEAFAPYGEIQEIKIMRSEETSRNLSYGFIKFSTPQSAKIAMNQLNGVILCGRPLRIRWATYKNKMGVKEQRQDVLETSPVHVSFISYQIDKLVTEESLRLLFSQYGDVVDASIKKSMIDQDVRRQSGYGFVHYAITNQGIHAAIRAATSLDDITVESVNYKCSLSHNLNKYLTGELTLPAENPVGPAGNMGTPMNASMGAPMSGGMGGGHLPPGAGGGMHAGFDEMDSEQYFRSPPQSYASIPAVRAPGPPTASVYRPNQQNPPQPPQSGGFPQQPSYGLSSAQYQNGAGGPQQQQYGMPPPQQQQQQHYNNNNNLQQPRGPQLYRSNSYGHSSIPSSQNGSARPRSLPSAYPQGLNPDTPPFDRAYDEHMGHHHSQYPGDQYGQNPYDAPLAGQHSQAPYAQRFHMEDADNSGHNNTGFAPGRSQSANGRSVGGPGSAAGNIGYAPRHSQQFSSGSATLAALGNRGGPVGSRSTGAAPGAPVGPASSRLSNVSSAPNMNQQQHQGFGAPDRWSAGSYSVVPPGPSGGINGRGEAGLNDDYLQPPGPPAPHRGPMPPSQGFHQRGNSSHSELGRSGYNDFSIGQSGSDPMQGLSAGLSGLQVQPPSQAYPPQAQQQQAQAHPQHFSSHFGLQGGSQPTQGPPQQHQQHQFFSSFQQAPGPYSAPNATITVKATGPNGQPVTLHLSPPPSPLPTYTASPVMSSGLGGFGQFLNGYSPVFRTAQTSALNPFQHPSMSPMSPRDVKFEESISNVHNLITPATYFRSSPLVVGHDLAYSPAMFQGNFSTNANVFGTNANQGYNAYQGFDLNMYNAGGGNNSNSNAPRSQIGRSAGMSNNNNKPSPLAMSNNNMSSAESTDTTTVAGAAPTGIESTAAIDLVLPVPPLASVDTGESFFGAALDGSGESLEALEPESGDGALEGGEAGMLSPETGPKEPVDASADPDVSAGSDQPQQESSQQCKEDSTTTTTAAATADSTPAVAKPAPAPSRRCIAEPHVI